MSITDDVRNAGSRPHDGRDGEPSSGDRFRGDGQFDRMPPQDVAAEQSVLGGMLLSKDAIADVVEILRVSDFYKPAHATIFEAIIDIYGRGEPADAITVAAALHDAGDLARVGGAAYLHTLIASVPTAANAAYYAKIVAERATLRRLIEAGTRIVQLGYGSAAGQGRDIDDLVDLAQQSVYEITERRTSEDFASIAEVLQPTLDEIEAVGAQGGVMTGVPTGFSDLDRLLNGLHPGQLIIVAGRPGLGKALALDTPLPTPDGWTTMGEVKAGDRVLGADGRPTTIVNAFDVLHDRPCYEVEFSDGTVIVADAEHLWKTTTRASRRQRAEAERSDQWTERPRAAAEAAYTAAMEAPDTLVTFGEAVKMAGEEFRNVLHVAGKEVGVALMAALLRRVDRLMNAETTTPHPDVVTTAHIAETMRHPVDGRANHAVENCRPLALPDRSLPLPPYVFGVWLGDGHSRSARYTSDDPEIAMYIEAEGIGVQPQRQRRYALCVEPAQPRPDRTCADCGGDVPGKYAGSARCWSCYSVRGSVGRILRAMGVLGNKHVPPAYLRASEAQRRALLAGLLDTDGTVTSTGSVQYCSTSRRLAEDVYELVVSLGYRCTMTSKKVKGRTAESSTAYILNFTTVDDVFRLERKRLAHKERRRSLTTTSSGSRFIVDVRPVPSVPVRCIQVDNDDHLYLAGRSMIPTHNSTASMDFARNAAIRARAASAIFSLEMSKVEIVMRVLSAEARVPLHVLRSGQLSDDDWTKLARCMGEISDAPFFVDDTPNMNLMEIRAKARRLKQKHDLKLIVVDYLQLMSSPKRTESRQQEVAELSRGLKLLAKEVEAPVIAVSQLNRGPEQRTDKRPQLSDLRESGCLTAATRILRADTGAETTIGELLSGGATNVPVWSADETLRYRARTLTHAFPSGVKEVFTLTLASGRTVEATANHPFLTFDGWKPLGDLARGSRIAVARHVPAPLVTVEWPEAEVIMLAHLLGDGSFVKRQPIRYASVDEQNLTAVTEAARHFGITAVRDEYAAARCTSLRLPAPYRLTHGRRNPIAAWLDGLGLFGARSHEKFIPDAVSALPKRQIALFIRHLWATDGSVSWDEKNGQARIYYASTSRRLIDRLALLLLRFGIQTHIKTARKAGYRDGHHLVISGGDDQLRFLREIGVYGARSGRAERCLIELAARRRNTNRDTVPKEVWASVRQVLLDRGMSHREFSAAMGTQFCGSTLWKHAPSRQRLAKVAAVLEDAGLEMHATNDMYWDEVVSIQSVGEQPVYDATVLGTHNFIANGIAVHNSIEQDADVVILLHRDDYYDKESPRAGEADFIVAKHRNGPTDTITVAAQLHLSRFVDMAI